MTMRKTNLVASILGALVVIALVLSGYSGNARAQTQPTTTEIFDALKSRAKTRSLSPTRSLDSGKTASEQNFINGLRTRSARSLTIEEREKVAEIAKDKPNIDLEIQFDYDSALVGPKAVPVLLALGRALSADEMKGTIFLINGHTDATGGFEYNQTLSERRAEAVKKLLVEQFGIPAANLIAVGYGKTMLKNYTDPFASENRRVQIVNTEHTVTAGQ